MWDDDRYSGYQSREMCLWKAVRQGDLAEVERVLTNPYGAPNLQCLNKGETLVHFAIRNQDYAIAETLLKAGADINTPTGYTKFTPFIYACDKGDMRAIELLLKYKADVNARTFAGETALHRAAWRGDDALITRLIDELDCDVNAQNDMGQTALFCAISSNLPETIKTLLELGVDPDVEGSVGFGKTTARAFAGGMEQRQDVAATLDNPSHSEAWKNKIFQPVTKKPVAVGKPLSFKPRPPGTGFMRLG
jgi:ankyrin repeat protein